MLSQQIHIGDTIFPPLYFDKEKRRFCFSMRSVLTHLLTNETVTKLLDCARKNQNYIHIDTYYCKSELKSWRKINIIVFNTRFLPPTNQKFRDSSTYWQFFCYRSPGKFWYSVGEIAEN